MAEVRIAVLVSVGAHPVSGAARWSRNDAQALAMGQALATSIQALRQPSTVVDIIHAGDPAELALRDYLALGAPVVQVLEVPPARDILAPIAERIRGYDIVLRGTRAEGGEASGMTPYRVAQALHMPVLPAVLSAKVQPEGVIVQQFLPKGRRREVAAPLPVVLVVHPQASFELRHVYARERAGQVLASASTVEGASLPPACIAPATRPPIKLAARESRSARARLMTATTTESRGGAVIIHGSPDEKAQAVLAYLRTHSLIDY